MITDSVGLDIGRTAFKAVRFRKTLTGRESVTYFRQELPGLPGSPLSEAQLADLLREFIRTNRLAGATIVTALACRDLFIRQLALPFRDPKKLLQVVPYEVENLIPLPLEEVAVDYQLLGPAKRNGSSEQDDASDVLVAVVPKATLAQHVQLLARAGIKPSLIDVDALALFALEQHLDRHGSAFPPDLAMIDLGASKTTICLTHQGHPLLIRTIGWGGDHLTEALAKRHGCSFAEAEQMKREMTAQQFEPWLTALVRDLQITLHGYETTTRTRLQRCWLSGGGSELKELPSYLARQLELEPIDDRSDRQTVCPPAFAIAFGLAVKPQPLQISSRLGMGQTSVAINLNRITEATPAKQGDAKRDLWLIGMGSLVVLLIGLADLAVGVYLKEARLSELKAALQTKFHEQFPGIEAADEVDQARSLLASVNKTIALLGGDQVKVLLLLNDLVHRLPKGLVLKMTVLTVEHTTLQMEAETDSFDSVEKVKQGLSQFPGVQDVAVSDARVGSAPNQVRFRVTVTLRTA
jgi:general secretion pathway protein L